MFRILLLRLPQDQHFCFVLIFEKVAESSRLATQEMLVDFELARFFLRMLNRNTDDVLFHEAIDVVCQ